MLANRLSSPLPKAIAPSAKQARAASAPNAIDGANQASRIGRTNPICWRPARDSSSHGLAAMHTKPSGSSQRQCAGASVPAARMAAKASARATATGNSRALLDFHERREVRDMGRSRALDGMR